MVPCGKCGQAIDPTKAVYSKQGELICKSCESNDIVTEGYLRAAKSMCYGALAAGLTSLIFNPFYILSISAIATGIRAVMLLSRQEYKDALRGGTGPLMAAAVVGLLAASVYPAIALLTALAIISR